MIVLKSILSLWLIRSVFAAPSIMVWRQNVGADVSLVRLPDQSASITQELGHPINERDGDGFLFKCVGPSSVNIYEE